MNIFSIKLYLSTEAEHWVATTIHEDEGTDGAAVDVDSKRQISLRVEYGEPTATEQQRLPPDCQRRRSTVHLPADGDLRRFFILNGGRRVGIDLRHGDWRVESDREREQGFGAAIYRVVGPNHPCTISVFTRAQVGRLHDAALQDFVYICTHKLEITTWKI